MDWALAIDRNRNQLLRIITALFALAGLAEGGMVDVLPRRVYRAVLLILRPAETAVRRLVIIAARGLVFSARPARSAPAGLLSRTGTTPTPAFLLIDPLKRFAFDAPLRFAGPGPRISVPGLYDPVFIPERVLSGEDLIDAERMCLRLHALKRALDNLPRQARRLARWTARQGFARECHTPLRSMRLSPFRPGRPPGLRKRAMHEVDEVLRECHALALDAYSPLNSS